MKVIEIQNILKKDMPLHYRNEYTGQVVFQAKHSDKVIKRVEFSLEKIATGEFDVQIQFQDALDYPLIPVIKTLKEHILQMEKEGVLR